MAGQQRRLGRKKAPQERFLRRGFLALTLNSAHVNVSKTGDDEMGNENDTLRVFGGNANPALAAQIAHHLGLPLGRLHCRRFADGEIQVKVEESVRGMDVFIVQPTCAPANDSLMELLILVDAFRRASAKRITLVMPYYGYSRQDKKIKPREPVTARLVADLITTAGAHRVLAVDLHAGQIQGFFQLPLDHLYAGPLLASHLAEQGLTNHDTVVVSSRCRRGRTGTRHG